jgi:hypothetical protein
VSVSRCGKPRKQELLARIEYHTARQTSRDLAFDIGNDDPERTL